MKNLRRSLPIQFALHFVCVFSFVSCGSQQPQNQAFSKLQHLEAALDRHEYAVRRCEEPVNQDILNGVCEFTAQYDDPDMHDRCEDSKRVASMIRAEERLCP